MCKILNRNNRSIDFKKEITGNESLLDEINFLSQNLIRLTRSLDKAKLSQRILSFKNGLNMVKNEILLPSDIEFKLIEPFSDLNKGILDITLNSSHFNHSFFRRNSHYFNFRLL